MRWTEEELQHLREHYPDGNTAEIATARRNETIRKDKMRIRWGLEPKTKIVKKYYAK